MIKKNKGVGVKDRSGNKKIKVKRNADWKGKGIKLRIKDTEKNI
jgi:hypothetical protein